MDGKMAALSIGLILFLASLLVVLNEPPWVGHINDSITLATTVLGFALAVFGAVRSGFALTGSFKVTLEEAVPSGAAAAAGALILIAARLFAA